MSKLDKYLEEAIQSKDLVSNTKYKNSGEYVKYLKETLIPDIRESGKIATAQIFTDAVKFIGNYDDKAKAFVDRLQKKLVNELSKSGRKGLVDDYKELIHWIKKG